MTGRQRERPVPKDGALSLCALVLFPRGQSAANVALRLVFLQHRLHLRVERAVIQRQALGQVLMYRGLADAELFRGGADGRPVFYEVKGQLPGPLFQILSDRAPLLYTFAAGLCIWRARRVYAFGLLRGGLCPLELPL